MSAPPSAGLVARAAAAAQVFVDDPGTPVLVDDDRHHLFSVLRLHAGELVVAADGAGRWCLCRCAGTPVVALEPVGEVMTEPAEAHPFTVAFAPAKGDRPEWVVQKLTELGADRIVPLETDHSVVRWRGPRAERSAARLAKVAKEAAAQSRRVWLPRVEQVTAFTDFTEAWRAGALRLALADPGGGPPGPRMNAVAVGPEGGWSASERALGLPTLRLADGVLRAETAALAAGALLAALRAGTVATKGAGPQVGES